MLSSDPDASRLPFGESAIVLAELLWPSSVATAAPNLVSHSYTMLSFDPDASSLPSDENAMV